VKEVVSNERGKGHLMSKRAIGESEPDSGLCFFLSLVQSLGFKWGTISCYFRIVMVK